VGTRERQRLRTEEPFSGRGKTAVNIRKKTTIKKTDETQRDPMARIGGDENTKEKGNEKRAL